jgi:hypothetical protein
LDIELEDGSRIVSLKEPESTLAEQLLNLGVAQEQLNALEIEVVPPTDWMTLLSTGGTVLMLLAFAAGIYVLMRQFRPTIGHFRRRGWGGGGQRGTA